MLHETSRTKTPEQNGVAKYKNCHILKIARALLIGASVLKQYWVDVIQYVIYLMNRLPSQVLDFRTLIEVLATYVPLTTHLHLFPRIFGCVAYVHIHKDQRSKLDPCALRCVFLCLAPMQKGYRCYHPPT